MKRDQIDEKVKTLLSDELAISMDSVRPESRLKEDLGFDSLDLVEIVMLVEDEFKIEVSDTDAEGCETVASLCDLVERLLEG